MVFSSNDSSGGLASELLGLLKPVLHPSFRVADIGCGGGAAGVAIAPYVGGMIMVDPMEASIEVVKERCRKNHLTNVSAQVGDVSLLEDGSMDLVLFSLSLHHIPCTERTLQDCYRILKPGGRVVILEIEIDTKQPFHVFDRVPYDGFKPSDLLRQLQAANFSYLSCMPFGILYKNEIPYNLFLLRGQR